MTDYEHRHSFASHEIDLAITIARQIGFYLERRRAEEARKVAKENKRRSLQIFDNFTAMRFSTPENVTKAPTSDAASTRFLALIR